MDLLDELRATINKYSEKEPTQVATVLGLLDILKYDITVQAIRRGQETDKAEGEKDGND